MGPDGLVRLDHPEAGGVTVPFGISNNGVVVGYYRDAQGDNGEIVGFYGRSAPPATAAAGR